MSEIDRLIQDSGLTEEELKQLFMMLDEAMQELPKSLGKPDWTYRDLPRMTPDVMEEFIQLVSEENIEWITIAKYDDGSVRGQVLLSPVAMAAIEMVATKASVN